MSHKVIKDFGQGDDPESITVTSYWIIAIYRQKYPVTFNRATEKPFTTDIPKGLELFSKPLIITDDCFQLSVNSTKTNHIASLSAGLYPGENYLHLINPGDWMCAWMVQNESTFKTLIKRIKNGEPCNLFEDGLKFFGKVNNIRKQLIQDPNGPRRARYSLTGTGFSEFDATLYYNPYLAAREDLLATQFGRFGYDINQLIDKSGGGITSDKIIPQIIDVLLGKGTPTNLKQNNPEEIKTTAGTEGAFSYILPTEMGKLIGKNITTKRGGIGYSDLLELVVGIQSYNEREQIESSEEPVQEEKTTSDWLETAKTFQPRGTEVSGSRRFTSDTKLLGVFLPTSPAFTNKTVWNVLREFLNSACNEMYTTLRVNPDGVVVPTLVVRQLPFTSELANLPITTTKFLSLPRWELHPILIKTADIGRSDSLRFNFINVLPVSSAADARNPAAVSAQNPAMWDGVDIARNGLRPYQQTIPAFAGDTRSNAIASWRGLITDILMGQHMTITGQITCVGIQSPICIGDNIEFDGVVYHIETITHSAMLSENGQKTFNTTLSLTHGINANPNEASDESIYAYTGALDSKNNNYDPKVTNNSTIERDEHELRGVSTPLNEFNEDTDIKA